jgi:hypothetical protein
MRNSLNIVQNTSQTLESLPSTEQLLISGGDERLALDPVSGMNKYGCRPFPDPQLLAFGSSTASIISTESFAAADKLRNKLQKTIGTKSPVIIYNSEIERIRSEWLHLCELSDVSGLELLFSPSGTDVHAVATQYATSGTSSSPLIIMVEANETGSGVASALAKTSVTGNIAVEVVQVPIRMIDGTPRPSAAIDTEVETLASEAAASDRRVLLILVDQSKTGLIAPSPACAMELHRRFPYNVEVLIDACQFRIATPTLRAYLEQGFMVALTGSKFLTAPSFSAALLLPSAVTERFQKRTFPRNLAPCSSIESRTPSRAVNEQLGQTTANFGLLLRCEAALEELRRFRTVPQAAIVDFLQVFAETIRQRLQSDPHFEPLPVPELDRSSLIEANSWDHYQTIFPFLLYYPRQSLAERVPLSREETLTIYKKLQVALDLGNDGAAIQCGSPSSLTCQSPDNHFVHYSSCPEEQCESPSHVQSSMRCQLGQPVACGTRNGTEVSALRLCISSRLIIEATTNANKGSTVIKHAQMVLDKTALLIQLSK